MAYAAKADIQGFMMDDQKLIQLTDWLNTGQMDDTKITKALDDATADIDSYVGGRYDLPLVQSGQVKEACVQLAIFKLYERRQMVSEWATGIYDRATQFLEGVRDGKRSLDQPTKVQSTAMKATTKDHAAKPDVFDENKLTNS